MKKNTEFKAKPRGGSKRESYNFKEYSQLIEYKDLKPKLQKATGIDSLTYEFIKNDLNSQ